MFRALAALAEDPGLVPSTHVVAHNHPFHQNIIPGDPTPSSGF